MPIVKCPVCKRKFLCKAYRLKREWTPCCSYVCAHIALKEAGFKYPRKANEEKVLLVKKLYTRTTTKIEDIAKRTGLSRSTIFNIIRENNLKPFDRKYSIRTIYRNAAKELLGRDLIRYEQVHHIDGNKFNNELTNLFVFKDAREHSIAHGSLEKCAFELFKNGNIKFKEGKYFL